jgi:aminodeoxychorismate synthase component I
MRRRVISAHLDFWVEPSLAFTALCQGDGPAFWLDSGVAAGAGVSSIGTGTRVVTSVDDGVADWPSGAVHDGPVFDFLRAEQSARAEFAADDAAFSPGWVGWLGYELRATTLGQNIERTSRYPDAAFLFADRAVVFDQATQTLSLVALGDSWIGELAEWRDETSDALSTLEGQPEPSLVSPTQGAPVKEAEWAHSDAEYLAMIAECQRRIAAGDAYQLCLTTQFSAPVHPDPVETYLRLRQLSPSHHGGFLRIDGVSLLSSSPEQFLSVSTSGRVESKPIKGTRKRGKTVAEDNALRAELVASDKERAENLMIVDLVRNDLSRVCEVGSVSVPHLLAVESYAQVHQLVSTVSGALAAGREPIDAVIACFPAGSMTGAPKISAVDILDSLERRPRGIYSGAFGYFGLDGRVDLAMVIRSIVLDTEGATIGTGGGITSLSVPLEELEETRIKAHALLRVLGLVNS